MASNTYHKYTHNSAYLQELCAKNVLEIGYFAGTKKADKSCNMLESLYLRS